MKDEIYASKNLAKTDLNADSDLIAFKTYWCRVAYDKVDKWNTKEHSHSFFELHLCMDGSCEFDVDGKKCTITKGKYLLLPPYKKHTILKASENFSKFVWGFAIQDEELSNEVLKNCSSNVETNTDENIYNSIKIMLENSKNNGFEYYNIIKCQLYCIFISLIRKKTSRKTSVVHEKKTSMRAREIKKFIKENLSSKLKASDIAAQFFMSERHLSRICLKEYNMTIQELKQSIQLESIKNMLSDTDSSLKEIAKSTGFSDEYAMSKFFKKHEGMPPAKYRHSIAQ